MGRADKNPKELTAQKDAFSAALNQKGIKSGVERTILTLFCTLLLSNPLFYAKLEMFTNIFLTSICAGSQIDIFKPKRTFCCLPYKEMRTCRTHSTQGSAFDEPRLTRGTLTP